MNRILRCVCRRATPYFTCRRNSLTTTTTVVAGYDPLLYEVLKL